MDWKFELVAGPFRGATDGPVWDGEGLLFCAVGESRILRYDPRTGAITEFRKYTSETRGLGFDAEGNLYGCPSASRRIVRFDRDGSTIVMEFRLDGEFHNYPDDLVADGRGRIWFSDPIDPITIGGSPKPLLDHASVLRLEPTTGGNWKIRRMTYDTTAPRGVRLSADERILYVAESGNPPDGKRELRAYPILEDAGLGPCSVLHTFGADEAVAGICLDSGGNILACGSSKEGASGPMIYVISPTGRVLETHPVLADRPTSCTFGDAGLRSLYVTTGDGRLFRVPNTGRQGFALYPGRRDAQNNPVQRGNS